MAVYQFNAPITTNPLAFARAVASAFEHFDSWGSPKPTAATMTGAFRLRVTVDFVVPQDQLNHLGVTLISP